MALLQRGNPEEAARLLRLVLAKDPNHFDSLHLLGVCNAKQGRYDEAYALMNKALGNNPRSAEALNNRGNVLQALNRHEEAIASYEQAFAIKPDFAEALSNRGDSLQALHRNEEAVASYDKALALKPHHADTLHNRGNALAALNRHEEAIASYDKFLRIKPDSAKVLYNRGNSLRALHRHAEAIASYDKALALKPDYALALNNRGNALVALKQHAEAAASYERALSISPDYSEAHFNESLARLALGDLAAGWEQYEWRWKKKDFTSPKRDFKQPLWLGKEPLAGKTILLHAEQGLGDTIQFVRYAPMVSRQGARVLLEVQAPLRRLLEGFEGVERVISKGEALPEFDLHCPLLSLPHAFGTTLQTIPSGVPYLSARAGEVEQWRHRLGVRTRPRVGIVWSGRRMHTNDYNRSIPLPKFLVLSRTELQLVSLQKDLRAGDEAVLARQPDILRFGEELEDFSDTAGLVSLMDLVISVDTSVAHLAGALGKRVWILLPFAPDWRWLLGREDNPWYPTARLFRQPAIEDWQSVFARACGELGSCLNDSGNRWGAPDATYRSSAALPEQGKGRPPGVSATMSQAVASFQRRDFTEAERLCRSILQTNPENFDALHLVGVCKAKQKQYNEAYSLITQGLAANPRSAAGHSDLGLLLHEMGRPEAALESCERALAIKPDHVEALNNRGLALAALNRHDAALESCERALAIKPDHVKALNTRGVALAALNRPAEAIASYHKALALKPEYPEAQCNWALARLTLGDLTAGWEQYEWRWKKKDFTSPKRDFKQPLWLGKEPLAGKTILLHAEQGLGDAIQFVRYAPMVARQGARVLLEVQAPLRRLLEGFEGVERVISKGEALPEFDLHCPLLSLPHAFGTTLQTIPSGVPYLAAPDGEVEQWRHWLGARTRPRVGIVWSGRPAHKNDHNRSIPLSALLALAGAGIEVVSLQKEVRAGDEAVLARQPEILRLGEELKDFSDTAGLVSLMDLVISVDTSVAHLAGALGKPVWILLPFAPDWRWLLDREDSPWYPTARLFRQPALGDWDSVVGRVVNELVVRFSSIETYVGSLPWAELGV